MDLISNDSPDKFSHHKKSKFRSKWYQFQSLTSTSAILRGSYAITSRHFKFGSRGLQASPCCIIAITYSNLLPPKELSTNHIDEILNHGDKLFRLSQTKNRLKSDVYMTPSMIYPEFYIDDHKCEIMTKPSVIFGNLLTATIHSPDFTEGLARFFKTYKSGVITSQGTSVAMWHHPTADYFYFDPSPCSENGLKSADDNGTACLIHFKYLNEMKDFFLTNLNQKIDSRYCIDAISVLKTTLIDRKKIIGPCPTTKNNVQSINPRDLEQKSRDCTMSIPRDAKNTPRPSVTREPLKITISNYKIDEKFATEPLIDQNEDYNMEINIPSTFNELPGNMAILHGWTHENSDVYKGKGLQNVANCIMSIAVKKIRPVRTWLRPTIDEILALGDSLYFDVKSTKPTIKSLGAADLNDTAVIVDGKKLFIDVDLITVTGTISSKVPGVLNLKQALEEFFLVNKDGIIECSSMAAAVWIQDDTYYMFDSKQCGPDGVRVVDDKSKSRGKGKKKESTPETKKIDGKSCVLRFKDVESLVGHFLKNVESNKKNDRFTIRHVSVMTDIPGTRPWCDFEPAEAGKTWILYGNLSNDSEELGEESQGNQGIAMPISGLIKATEIPPNLWAKETIDEAIKEGDEFYNYCISPEAEEETELSLRNLKYYFYSKNRKVKFSIEESAIVGDIAATAESQLPNMEVGVENFFKDHQFGILEIGNLAVALWKFDEEQKVKAKAAKEVTKETAFYCFDPNPREKMNRKDLEDEGPAACVIRSLQPSELARVIKSNVNAEMEKTEFFIHAFKVDSISDVMTPEEVELDKQTPERPELNAYTELNTDGAFLNGSFDQTNAENFKPRTRDKQQAANALVTLAMSKLYNPHLWYREVVDDILKLGDKITADNLQNLPDEEEAADKSELRDFLIPSEIDESFDIGVNRVTISIDEGVSSPAAGLENSLGEFFKENSLGILRQDHVILPIWREGNIYFTLNPRGIDDKNEVATVFWFTNIPSLTAKIREFIHKPDDNITIDLITLENEYETRVAEGLRPLKSTSTEELWHNFPKKSDGIYELTATISMMDERFAEENRGKQSAAIAMMAVIFSKAYEPRLWTSEILNEVLITGDKLHSKSVARLGENVSLKINEILTEFFLSERRLHLDVKDCVEAGALEERQAPKIQNLLTGMENFFKHHISGVITLDNTNMAIWRAQEHYYCLLPDATPRLMRFNTLELLDEHIKTVYPYGDYEIHGVNVINWNKLPPWKFDPSAAIRPSNLPPLNAFRAMSGGARAILRAGIHQGTDIYPDSIKNRQTAANCVVSLGMSIIKNPITWTKKTLDDILAIGCGVHRESLKYQSREKIKPQDVSRIFQIGVNVLTADVEAGTVVGQVAIPPPEPEVKGKKKPKKPKKPAKSKGKKKKSQREPPAPVSPILLEQGLVKFFENNHAGILTTGRFMVALWKDQGVYFLFDPRSRNALGLVDEHGVACVMWFACLEPFYDTIFRNIDDEEKFGGYEISRIIVRTAIIEPLPNPVGFQGYLECMQPPMPVMGMKKTVTIDVTPMGEFFAVNNGLSILLGHCSMNDRGFATNSRGFQSTAMAAVAIVVSVLHVPAIWNADLVDSIVKSGDILYKDSERMARAGPRTLSPSELLTVFIVGDVKVRISVYKHIAAGILLIPDVTEGLGIFFKANCAGILHTPNLAVAVMQHYGKFYLFDPREFDKTGRISYGGSASVAKCDTIVQLAKLFVDNCNYKVPCVYTLNAVNITSMNFFS